MQFSPQAKQILSSVMLLALSWTLSGCATSAGSADKTVDVPPLPANVRNAGKVVAWPTEVTQENALPLVTTVRQSELKNARAVQSCIASHEKLTLIYGAKK